MPKTAAPWTRSASASPEPRSRDVCRTAQRHIAERSRGAFARTASCEGQRLFLCPRHTLHVEGLRVDMFQVEALATAELLKSALEEDVQNPLDLLHTRRQAQKVVLRLDVRLGRPRRKLRFLHAASKDLDGQQVCTVGDHAEEAAQVPSKIEQQHEGLSGKFAHRVRMVHEQSVQCLEQNPASQEIRDQSRAFTTKTPPCAYAKERSSTLMSFLIVTTRLQQKKVLDQLQGRGQCWSQHREKQLLQAQYTLPKAVADVSPARAGTSTRRLSCNPSCCSVLRSEGGQPWKP